MNKQITFLTLALCLVAGCGSGVVADAAYAGNLDRVRSMVTSGSDVDAKEESGYTGLMWAAMKGRYDIAEFLVTHGANPNIQDEKGTTALHIAATASVSQVEIVKLLLSHKAAVDIKDSDGDTALLLAANPTIVAALVEAGADVNASNRDGLHPLFAASARGDAASVQLLLAKGARGDDKTAGKTPLMALCSFSSLGEQVAGQMKRTSWDSLPQDKKAEVFDGTVKQAWDGYLGALRVLIKAGSDPRATDDLGQTALHWAVASLSKEWVVLGGARAVVKLPIYDSKLSEFGKQFLSALLDAGAPTNATTKAGKTPVLLLRSLRSDLKLDRSALAPISRYLDDMERLLVDRGAP
jgi:ankyrin repeat protein